MKTRFAVIIMMIVVATVCLFSLSEVYADGTETLGPPVGITIAEGTGIAAGGTGMVTQSGTITVNVPPDATVKQVLLYWDGQSISDSSVNFLTLGDDTISINGNSVTGTLIGGPAFFFTACTVPPPTCNKIYGWSSVFRADITGLRLVGPGTNVLTVSDMGFDFADNGAGILVIYDDGISTAGIQLRDGLDLAFINFPEPRKSTIQQDFVFAPASVDRFADLVMFVGSVHDDRFTPATDRPTSLEVDITVGAVTTTAVFSNPFSSFDGPYWDSVTLPNINIPAGAGSLSVQVFSRDDLNSGNLPASLEWIGAFFALEEFCGDGIKQANEQCDDGNLINNDGCSSICKLEVCGEGIKQANEQCDDGNQIDNDGCDNDCKLPVCGDGVKEGMEQCDDGNLINGDGCSATCTTESRCPGTGTPGYWKNHPEAWPVAFITIGGKTYTKTQAIALISCGDGNKLFTLFRSLVAAKLNVLMGCGGSCINGTILKADAWMAKYAPNGMPLTCGGKPIVYANSKAWKVGEPLYWTLDKYNNGQLYVNGALCAPHRN